MTRAAVTSSNRVTRTAPSALGVLSRVVAGGWAALSISACGAGAAGEAVRPTDPSYAAAAGDKGAAAVCHDVEAEGTPLVVDWKPEDRADLEVAMQQGVAVVHYDCDGVKLLPDCRVEKLSGKYKYIGITRKEQVMTLDNADEAKANLPLSGAKIGASLARGSSLDVALVMVGKTTAPALKVDKTSLSGRCDGATHFVRGAVVGAFAMKTRTSGKAGAAGDVFGAGASAESSSEKGVSNKEGDIQSCQESDADAPKAPKNCGAPLRLQLVGLGHEIDPKAPPKEVACPKGTVAVAGVCTAPTKVAVQECKGDDVDECVKSCDGGSVESCQKMYLDVLLKVLDDAKYEKVALHLEQKACALGSQYMCSALGQDYEKGQLGLSKDPRQAATLYATACKAGDADGCYYLGKMVPVSDKTALLFTRACDAGSSDACNALGDQLEHGLGVTANPAAASDAYRRGCAIRPAFKGCKTLK